MWILDRSQIARMRADLMFGSIADDGSLGPLTPWKTSRAHLQPAIYFSHTEYLKFSRLACSVFAWNDFCMTDDWKSA